MIQKEPQRISFSTEMTGKIKKKQAKKKLSQGLPLCYLHEPSLIRQM